MLPLFQKEFIATGMITYDQFQDIMTISQMTPGSFAINAATFIGKDQAGFWGAAVSTLAVALPSLLALWLLIKVLRTSRPSRTQALVFEGLRPCVLGFIASAVLLLAPATFVRWQDGAMFAASFALIASGKIHPILVIFLMGAVGMLL